MEAQHGVAAYRKETFVDLREDIAMLKLYLNNKLGSTTGQLRARVVFSKMTETTIRPDEVGWSVMVSKEAELRAWLQGVIERDELGALGDDPPDLAAELGLESDDLNTQVAADDRDGGGALGEVELEVELEVGIDAEQAEAEAIPDNNGALTVVVDGRARPQTRAATAGIPQIPPPAQDGGVVCHVDVLSAPLVDLSDGAPMDIHDDEAEESQPGVAAILDMVPYGDGPLADSDNDAGLSLSNDDEPLIPRARRGALVMADKTDIEGDTCVVQIDDSDMFAGHDSTPPLAALAIPNHGETSSDDDELLINRLTTPRGVPLVNIPMSNSTGASSNSVQIQGQTAAASPIVPPAIHHGGADSDSDDDVPLIHRNKLIAKKWVEKNKINKKLDKDADAYVARVLLLLQGGEDDRVTLRSRKASVSAQAKNSLVPLEVAAQARIYYAKATQTRERRPTKIIGHMDYQTLGRHYLCFWSDVGYADQDIEEWKAADYAMQFEGLVEDYRKV